MKQRILNKKLRKDCLIQLWIKEWKHSNKLLIKIMPEITEKDYKDKTSLWYCQYKINNWLMNYEFDQAIKIGKLKYHVREEQIYNYILPHKNHLTYQQYKRLCR